MVHTVGIVGVNGNVGAPTAQALTKAAEKDSIKLIIFHRPNTKLDGLGGKNVEFRAFDFDDPSDKIEAAVKGVNVFISAVGFGALPHEPKVVEALAKSPDLVTFIPSTYSTTWEPEDFDHPQLGPILKFIHGGWDKAKELGIGITPVYTGVFDLYWFDYAFVGAPIKDNVVWASENQLKNRIPIVLTPHLAAAIAEIATQDPHSVKNKEYSAVTFWPSGQEIVELYSKVNGKPAQVKSFTRADRDAQNADGANFGPAKVGYWDRWENDSFKYESGGKIVIPDKSGVSLEEVARRYTSK